MADDDWGYPGKWAARIQRGLLDANRFYYAVCLNNHTDVAWFGTLREAELDAARRNYEHGSYQRPQMIGL